MAVCFWDKFRVLLEIKVSFPELGCKYEAQEQGGFWRERLGSRRLVEAMRGMVHQEWQSSLIRKQKEKIYGPLTMQKLSHVWWHTYACYPFTFADLKWIMQYDIDS